MRPDISMPVAIYARYSTDKQDARSTEDQIRRCRRYAENHGYEVVEVYEDKAVSGAHADRVNLQRLLAAAKRRGGSPFRAVLVDDQSRLARDLGTAVRLIFEELPLAGVKVVDCSTGRASDENGARIAFGFNALLNDAFLEMVRAETHRGLEGRALTDFATGGRTYGYDTHQEANPPDPEHPRSIITIEVVEAEVVRRIFQWWIDGTSLKGIAARLNAEGVPAPHDGGRGNKGNRGWPHTTVRNILRNERYVGRFVWNKRKWMPVPGRKQRKPVERPQTEWIVRERPDLAIVDADVFEAAQARFRTIKRGGQPGVVKHGRGSLLSGLLRCGVCNGNMTLISRVKKASGTYANFGCVTHYTRGNAVCTNNKTISEHKIAAAVIKALRTKLLAPRFVERFVQEFKRQVQRQQHDQGGRTSETEKALKEIERRIANVTEAITRVGYSDALAEQLKVEEARRRALAAQLAQVVAAARPNVIPHPKVVEGYLANLVTLLEDDPARGRQALARHLPPLVLQLERVGDIVRYKVTGAFDLGVCLDEAQATKNPAPVSGAGVFVEVGSGGRI